VTCTRAVVFAGARTCAGYRAGLRGLQRLSLYVNGFPAALGSSAVARIRHDRLYRWTAYATLPFVWLAVALVNPLLLLVPPLACLALERAMTYGILSRAEAPPDPDDFL
jgi:hypothetical protein